MTILNEVPNTAATDVNQQRPNNEEPVPVNDPIDRNTTSKDSYKGRKNQPNIDGPEQASQETDEIYVDPRRQEDLPAGGMNVADLNAYDLTQKDNVSNSKNNDI